MPQAKVLLAIAVCVFFVTDVAKTRSDTPKPNASSPLTPSVEKMKAGRQVPIKIYWTKFMGIGDHKAVGSYDGKAFVVSDDPNSDESIEVLDGEMYQFVDGKFEQISTHNGLESLPAYVFRIGKQIYVADPESRTLSTIPVKN